KGLPSLALQACVLLGLGFGLVEMPTTASHPEPAAAPPTASTPVQVQREVFLGGDLSDEELITLTTAVAASGRPGVVLLDAPRSSQYTKAFLSAYRPARIIPVGTFPEGIPDLERRLGETTAPGLARERGPPLALWQALLPRVERVVLCPDQPRSLLLQSACLAGILQAPLWVTHGEPDEAPALRRQLAAWGTREVFAAGRATQLREELTDVRLVALADEQAVAAAYLRQQRQKGPIQTLVVANPADNQNGLGGMSVFAPWVALERRAALLLTNDKGDNTAAVVRAALQNPDLLRADALILVASLKAIPTEHRPNPVPGKDVTIEMEPLTPAGSEPFTFATGRLFHEDRRVVALMLARPRLLVEARSPRKALVVSNPGGSLPLLEIFSRNTAKEFHNAGYQTTALFNSTVTKEEVRHLLPEQDIFLWEGHYRTMVDEYGLPGWTEPLRPALIFLQSCLALNEAEAQPLCQRGALGVIGSSTRIYSASGGAFTLAFFDALLYEQQSLGASLRQAKNFLLCYALLKEKRLGLNAKLNGANLRSAWAFTLWGDPTLKLPRPEPPAEAWPAVRHGVRGQTLVVRVPERTYDKVTTGKYQAQMWPNARLAGLVTKEADEDGQQLVPLLFAEVSLPKAPKGQTPRLRSRVPETRWVFCWDSRRRCGYLLVTPRAKDRGEIRFQIEWEE
ncbi:MAG: C25 family cysteine peptidase, partial [Gemmataceae bacterium]|nr:C25 family cysteine peptidase [Gemmataceae bacterium]